MEDVVFGKIWNAVIINLKFLLPKCKVSVSVVTWVRLGKISHYCSFGLACIKPNGHRTKPINELAFVPRWLKYFHKNDLYQNERISVAS